MFSRCVFVFRSHSIFLEVFYEASTRTSCSFECAMMRLGGKVIHVDGSSGGNTSASKKGESLSDCLKCLQCYTDVTVLRHGKVGAVADVAVNGGLKKPVVNAGDGVGEHPTQALLDLFTIMDELGLLLNDGGSRRAKVEVLNNSSNNNNTPAIAPLVVVLLGDLKHGRTVHSLAKLLARSQVGFLKRPLVLRYCSPPGLAMPQHVKDYVDEYEHKEGCEICQAEYLDGTEESVREALKDANVLYVTRVQKERFHTERDYNEVKGTYVINNELMSHAPSNMIVMHPLPRVDEIETEFDSDPRAVYFNQMENGMFVRMGILALLLGSS